MIAQPLLNKLRSVKSQSPGLTNLDLAQRIAAIEWVLEKVILELEMLTTFAKRK
jgi:hypothetical protein